MTDSMVERVARAVFVAADDAHNTWPTPQHPECVKMARAAIAALRVPTEAMLRAVSGSPDGRLNMYRADDPTVDCADIWNAMIDTALEQRGDEG